MLDLYQQYTIDVGGDQQVTAWRDSDDPYIFYVMNQQPQFRIANNRPVFNFVNYKTAIKQDGSPQAMGGYASFDLEFKVDSDLYEKVRADLKKRLFEDMKDEKEKEAEARKIRWGSIPYSDGTASLFIPLQAPASPPSNASAGVSGSYVTVKSPGKPSLVGDNVASFSVEIPYTVSDLFEQLLNPPKGESPYSGITAQYELKFSAQLPPLTCTVKIKKDQVTEFAQKSSKTWNTWNTGYDVKREQDLTQSVARSDAIDIKWNVPEAKRSEEVERTVRTWAAEQYKDMLAQQIATIPTPQPDTDAANSATTFAQTIKNHTFNEDTRTYTERMAITCVRLPQGQLPTIPQVLKDRKSDESPGNYFRSITARTDFFDTMSRDVQPAFDFKDLGVKNLQVEIKYPALSETVGDSFDEKSIETKPKYTWRSEYEKKDGKRIGEYEYRLVVSYANSATQPYRSDYTKTDKKILQLFPPDVGILLVNVRAAGNVKWDDTPDIDVTVSYSDKSGKKKKIPAVTLNKDKKEEKIRYPVGGDCDTTKAFEYEIVYHTKGGTITKTGVQESLTRFEILVNGAISDKVTYTITPPRGYIAKNYKSIMLNLVYEDPQDKTFVQRESLKLDPAAGPWDWTVPVIDRNRSGKVTYSGRATYDNGELAPIPTTVAIDPSTGGDMFSLKLPAKARAEEPVKVEVDPSKVDWTTYAKVEFQLEYGTQDLKKFTFQKGAENQTYEFTPEDGTEYRWKADYRKQTGGRPDRIDWTSDSTDYLELWPSPSKKVPAS